MLKLGNRRIAGALMADLDNTPVVWYTNCGPQNMTVGQNVVFPNMAAQYNRIVQLSPDSFSLFG